MPMDLFDMIVKMLNAKPYLNMMGNIAMVFPVLLTNMSI